MQYCIMGINQNIRFTSKALSIFKGLESKAISEFEFDCEKGQASFTLCLFQLKTFFMLNSAEHKIFLLVDVKMPTIVGILTLMSMINTTSERQSKNFLHLSILVFMSS